MKWAFADAMNLALDMVRHGEIGADQLDETVARLWAEMQTENEDC